MRIEANLFRHRCKAGSPPPSSSFTPFIIPYQITKLVKALVDSNIAEGKPELQEIESSTAALIFLGTPHRGSSHAGWGEVASRIASAAFFDVNRKNLGALEVNGDALAQLEKNFGRLVMHHNFTIHNFQEAQGYKGVKGLNGRVKSSLLKVHVTCRLT